MIVKPRTVLFNIGDTKAAQLANKNKSAKNNTGEVGVNNSKLSFSNIFMRFESAVDCTFSAEVTFPEEEKYQARKRQAE